MPTVQVYLVRHGETIFNAKGVVQGQSDSPLTQAGQFGAIELGKKFRQLPIDQAYVSDLRRAQETLQLMLAEHPNPAPVQVKPAFREYNFGLYEGDQNAHFWDRMSQLHQTDVLANAQADFLARYGYVYHELHNPSAEKLTVFKNRLETGLLEVANEALEKQQEHLLIVSHGIVVQGLLQLFIPNYQPTTIFPNTSVTKFAYDGQGFQLDYFGKTAQELQL